MSEECVFCRIIRREEPAYIIYEDQDIIVFLDKYPLSYGHILVVPKNHYRDILDTPPNMVSKAFLVARAFGKASIRYLGASGFRIVTNKGSSAGQVIFHFHVHLIPRYGFGSPGPVEPREVIRESAAKELVSRYEKALADREIRDLIEGKI